MPFLSAARTELTARFSARAMRSSIQYFRLAASPAWASHAAFSLVLDAIIMRLSLAALHLLSAKRRFQRLKLRAPPATVDYARADVSALLSLLRQPQLTRFDFRISRRMPPRIAPPFPQLFAAHFSYGQHFSISPPPREMGRLHFAMISSRADFFDSTHYYEY